MRFIWYVAFSRKLCSLGSTDRRSLNRIFWNSAPNLSRYFLTKRSCSYITEQQIAACGSTPMQVKHSSTSHPDDDSWNNLTTDEVEKSVCLLKCCCLVSLYSICVSTVKSGSFWKRVTLNAICDHGGKYFQTWQADCESLSSNVIPNNLQIYYADINITTYERMDCCLLCVQMAN